MKKPTVEEVSLYMAQKGMAIGHDHGKPIIVNEQDEAFFDNFEGNGWLVGGRHKTPMKNWKSAVNTWIRNHKKWNKPNEKSNGHKQSFQDRQREQAQRAMQAMERGGAEIDAGNIRQIR